LEHAAGAVFGGAAGGDDAAVGADDGGGYGQADSGAARAASADYADFHGFKMIKISGLSQPPIFILLIPYLSLYTLLLYT
jgi:hypothetical protein